MIYGERIRLRAPEREDIPTFVRWFNDPEVRRYLLMYEPMSRAKEEKWFDGMLEYRDDFLFGIEAPVQGGWQLIGNTGLHRVDWRNRAATFGIVIGEQDFWNQGYGTDATRTMVRFAFDTLNLHRVQLEVFDYNLRARRAYEKVGFRLEGTRRQALFESGRYYDEHLMAVLRDDFAASL